jgi:hypothetical protein
MNSADKENPPRLPAAEFYSHPFNGRFVMAQPREVRVTRLKRDSSRLAGAKSGLIASA